MNNEVVESNINNTYKKSKGPIIVIIILILIIVGLVTFIYLKRDVLLNNNSNNSSNSQESNKKGTTNNTNDNDEKKSIDNNSNDKTNNHKLIDNQGTLNVERRDNNKENSYLDKNEISINDKTHVITYEKDNSSGVPGNHIIKLDNTVLVDIIGLNGISDLNYNIFTATDGKQYLLIYYKQWGYFGYIYNENGKKIMEFDEIAKISNDKQCFIETKENEQLIQVKNNNIYYYKYKENTATDNGNLKLQEVKITIYNDNVKEELSGNEKDGIYAQCA